MAGEIQVQYTVSGLTMYAIVRNSVGQALTISGLSFGTYSTASLAGYTIALTEQGTASRYYAGTFPAVAAGTYGVTIFQQAGGSAAETDTVVGFGNIEWDGSAVVSLNSRAPSSTALSTAQWSNTLATNIGTTNTTVAANLDATVSSRGTSTLTQAQVTGGAYSIQSSSCVLGDARVAHLDADISSRGTSTLTQAQVTGGAYSVQSSSCVLGDARMAHLDADVSTRAPSATALSTAQWTNARAGYLDNLNVGGAVASHADITAINQSASKHLLLATVGQYERPESGTVTYTVECRTFNASTGAAVNADSTPTITATGIVSGDLSANLSTVSNPATGVYRATYTVSSTDTIEQIRMDVSATISSTTFTLSAYTQVTDFVSVTWTSTDASHLTAIYNKLPANNIADETLLLAAIGSPQQVGTKYAVTLSSSDVTGNLAADLQTIKTQTVTCAAGVTIRADVGAAAAPGSSNGMLIGGSNAATTFASVTCTNNFTVGGNWTTTGTTTWTGAVAFSNGWTASKGVTFTNNNGDGFACTSTGGNGSGIKATGNGTGNGYYGIGGSGASGDGMHLVAGTGSGANGLRVIADGGGSGLYCAGGPLSGGHAAIFQAIGDNNQGLYAQGYGTGSGIFAASGTGALGDGITALAASTNGHGISCTGNGTGADLFLQSTSTNALVALTSAYDPAKTAAQAGDAMALTSAYDAAKTAAQAGDAMALVDGAITEAKITEPSDGTGQASGVLAKIGWLYHRFFGKVVRDGNAGTIKTYQADGTTVRTTQAASSAGDVDTVDAAV